MITCMCGYSGAGKTWYRTHDEKLKGQPCLDIADIYDDNPGIEPDEALVRFMSLADQMLQNGFQDIVLEAYFHEGGIQRALVRQLAKDHDQAITFIEMKAPYRVCRERVLADTRQDERRKRARLRLLDIARETGRLS